MIQVTSPKSRWTLNSMVRRIGPCCRALALLYVFLLSIGACGPGGRPGGAQRRSVRKLVPLVFKQHVPNVPETSLAASGPAEDRITREDPRFADLVANYNEDVVFKDRKGTGEDRIMTQRLREKLDALAISVMNFWPSVRVRVAAGYDGDEGALYLHAPGSLHFCARAVDLTTSDRDPSKYGMLARLAVEAGFDWVYFESRAHVHCSVRREPTLNTKNIGCFNGNATVRTKTALKLMRHLTPGDEVMSGFHPNGSSAYHKVITFLHRDPALETRFIRISMESKDILYLTETHLVFRKGEDSTNPTAVFASTLKKGDMLFIRNRTEYLQASAVIEVTKVTLKGVYAPLTESGTIVVDNVWTSCYAEVGNHELAHSAMLPLRIIYQLKDMYYSIFTWYSDDPVPMSKREFNDYVNSSFIHWYARLLIFVADFLPHGFESNSFFLLFLKLYNVISSFTI